MTPKEKVEKLILKSESTLKMIGFKGNYKKEAIIISKEMINKMQSVLIHMPSSVSNTDLEYYENSIDFWNDAEKEFNLLYE